MESKPDTIKQDVPEVALNRLFEAMACNVTLENPNATELAFVKLMDECKFPYEEVRKKLMPTSQSYSRILFTSFRKKSATIVKKDGNDVLFTFGSVNIIVKCCSKLLTRENTEVDLKPEVVQALEKEVIGANEKSLRTLGVAYKVLAPGEGGDDHLELIGEEKHKVEESGLTFLGLMGLKDPLREGVREAVKDMHTAGIIVRMVTGDTKATATAIAKDCGILPEGKSDYLVMEGTEFEARVGGLGYLCKSCEDRKANTKDAVVLNVEKPAEKQEEKKEEAEEKDTKKKKGEVKKCPICKEELQTTAKNMDEFKKIADKLMVISVCRPADKYLLVASLKYL